MLEFFFCQVPGQNRPSSLLQPALTRLGHRLDGWRMVGSHRERQHVHLRDRPGLHHDGAHRAVEDEGGYRVGGGRQHPCSWRLDIKHVGFPPVCLIVDVLFTGMQLSSLGTSSSQSTSRKA